MHPDYRPKNGGISVIQVYGSMLCKDCVECRKLFDEKGVSFEYKDFADELINLKTFLNFRETLPVFDEVKRAGAIGIPCIVLEDGTVTLDYQSVM